MRCVVIALSLFLGALFAYADERPFVQLDTGGHQASITDLTFTPDGKFIVSAGDDKIIRVWDWRAGKTVRTIRGESGLANVGKIFAMALSPNGAWLAVGGWTHPECAGKCGDIRLYDFQSGELKSLLSGHVNVVTGLAFSADGKKLISGSADNDAIVWDVEKKALLQRLKGHSGTINGVAFTPDGARAITGSFDTTLRLWNVAGGTLIKEMKGHNDKVRSLTIVPRDGAIVSGDRHGGILLWDGKTGAFQKEIAKQGGVVGSLRFSPDGRHFLATCGYSGCDYTQRYHETASGKVVTAYTKLNNIVLASAISPDGSFVATGGGNNQEIHIWDPKTGDTKQILKGTGAPVWAVGFSADERTIAWGNTFEEHGLNNHGPLQFSLTLPAVGETLSSPVPVASQDGWFRATASSSQLSLNHRKGGPFGYDAFLDILKDGKPTGISMERDATTGLAFYSYTFTPDGKTILAGGGDGPIVAYNLEGKTLEGSSFFGHEGVVWAIAMSPKGRFLVSGSDDQTIRLWDAKSHTLLLSVFRGSDGEWIAWTPEGFYTSSEGGAKLVGWQINQGPDKAARYVTAGQLRKAFFRPDLVTAKILGDPDGLVRQAVAKLDIDALLKNAQAPEVAILSPKDGAKLGDASVSISARVTDQGGGVGKIGFRLNGQLVGSVYGAAMLDKNNMIVRSFDLATTETKIEIVAEDKSGQVLSLPAKITVKADPKAILGVPDLYVLAVGVDRYRDTRKTLTFAVKDAATLSNAVATAGAGFYRNPPTVKTLFDDDVTADKVAAAFKELGAKIKATDVFLFYMAGHGKTIDGDFHFLPGSMDGFSDDAIKAQGFGPSKLTAWFESVKAQKSIWIFDTCESGSAGKLFRIRDAAADDAAYRRLKEATGRTLFMAAAAEQSAIEGYRNHGVFTYALLEGLAKAGHDDKIQLFDLADYVENRVPEISRELKACDAKGPKDYCQKPIVPIGSGNYPLVPRYAAILKELGAESASISAKPTHVVLPPGVEIFIRAARGEANPVRKLKPGSTVYVIKSEAGWAQIAQGGIPLGFVEADRLLKIED